MKLIIIYISASCFFLSLATAQACCNVTELYRVVKVKSGDHLYVRKEPHPLAPVVTPLGHDARYFFLQKYNDNKEEMLQHKLCVTVKFAPFEGTESVSQWCKLQTPNGWVNMHYMSSCEVETGDDGSVIRSQCEGIEKGSRLSDYSFQQ